MAILAKRTVKVPKTKDGIKDIKYYPMFKGFYNKQKG